MSCSRETWPARATRCGKASWIAAAALAFSLAPGLATSAERPSPGIPKVDGAAALRHAAALAALGPHPWGSPRGRAAAAYVAAQMTAAGLPGVQEQEFVSHGIRGVNVVGTLPGPGAAFVVVGAHHDTAPDAPGAYDDGGGVGVMLEAARILATRPERKATFVFVSFDGEEAWWTRQTTVSGARAYVSALGPRARDLMAAFVVEMCGWKNGSPVLHPIAYADPLRPGAATVTPAWVMEAALSGSRDAGSPFGVGDPKISWLYQPTVRTFRIGLYGDDMAFLQQHLPAVFASDSSFTAFYPWYHRKTDTVDKLDAVALSRMGDAVVGAVERLAATAPGPASQPAWFAAFGRVLTPAMLAVWAVVAVVPGLLRSRGASTGMQAARWLQALLFAFVAWRHPVPTLWALAPVLLIGGLVRAQWGLLFALLPAAGLALLGLGALLRGMVGGLWLTPWDGAAAAAILVLAFLAGRPPSSSGSRGRGRELPPTEGRRPLR